MLIFGPADVLKQMDALEYVVFNLSSAYQCGYDISNVIPPLYNGMPIEELSNPMNDRSFDTWYINYIFSPNSVAFVDFFSMIMHIYNGNKVFVLVHEYNDIFNIIKESLIKIIQQRYGINSYTVEDIEDTFFLKETEDQDFSIQGIYNFDADRRRYISEMNLR